MNEAISKTISSWSDLGSLLFVALNYLLGGLSPSRPVWGRSLTHNLALLTVMLTSFLFTAFRYIHEGIYEESGPREFLAANVIYLSSWVYLWLRMNWPNSPESRMIDVARALRSLQMLRVGSCTKDPSHPRRASGGAREVVLRRGARIAPPGHKYWRGVTERMAYHEDVDTFEVHLVEENLHSDELDRFGTIEYMHADMSKLNDAYKYIYEVVIKAVAYSAPTPAPQPPPAPTAPAHPSPAIPTPASPTPSAPAPAASHPASASPPQGNSAPPAQPAPQAQSAQSAPAPGAQGAPAPSAPVVPAPPAQPAPQGGPAAALAAPPAPPPAPTAPRRGPVQVDFREFTVIWRPLPVERIASNVGATDDTVIGGIARRVAADAVNYIRDKENEFRTEQQILMINKCLRDTAGDQFPDGLRDDAVAVDAEDEVLNKV